LATRPTKGSKLEGAERGVQVHIVDQPTEKSEAEFVARQIEKMIGGVRFFSFDSSVATGEKEPGISSFRDFAVLCRVSRQMDVFETAFQDHGIPYQRIGEEPFYRKDPARQIINALRFSIRPDSEFLARRLILTGRVIPACSDEDVSDQIERIARLFLGPEEWDEETICRLQRLSEPFKKDTHSFLRSITLGTCGDDFEFRTESVALMTIHAAKGLEFSSVFIPGCEEGLIPCTIFKDRVTDIDEEKRLLYVGMTRAKKYLFLTHCRKRFLIGRNLSLDRSHFLDSIKEDLVKLSSVEIFHKTKKEDPQLKLF
jgi:superfamily I DNA/RNA helicase